MKANVCTEKLGVLGKAPIPPRTKHYESMKGIGGAANTLGGTEFYYVRALVGYWQCRQYLRGH